jgi:BirA family transcriptional regulator, biotin operon repressor / biotin---[acetyl-CoA-carboxylase] ligase
VASNPLFTSFVEELVGTRPSHQSPENLVIVRDVASTNLLAREIVKEYDQEEQELHSLLIVALEQNGGRGRQGRSWISLPGKGVYATRVLWAHDVGLLQTLPLLVGIGLCRALGSHLPVPCRLKWPNDLVVETGGGRRKIGGILIEAVVRPDDGALAIVGFGVNHGHETGELPETGTSLRLLHGEPEPLGRLLWDLVAGVEAELVHLGDTAYAAANYRELSVHRPGETLSCQIGERTVAGTFRGFDDLGRLTLETNDGEELHLSSGEILE